METRKHTVPPTVPLHAFATLLETDLVQKTFKKPSFILLYTQIITR